MRARGGHKEKEGGPGLQLSRPRVGRLAEFSAGKGEMNSRDLKENTPVKGRLEAVLRVVAAFLARATAASALGR